MADYSNPDPRWQYIIPYGPGANCTLDICPIEWSVYDYQPSLPANVTFLTLFAINLVIHIIQGIVYARKFLARKFIAFVIAMSLGSLCVTIGYAGRIMMHYNPFNFSGFMIQIICVGCGPVFFCAAIYFTICEIVRYLGPQYSRFRPALFYIIFMCCDAVSLSLQAVGGALSSTSSGTSEAAINVSLAGLSFQVFSLLVFVTLSVDYALRWRRAVKPEEVAALAKTRNFKMFIWFMSAATILIIARCAFRIDELSEGYNGDLIHNEPLFIGLEGVLIIVAAFLLNIGHPGIGMREVKKADMAEQAENEEMTTNNDWDRI